MADSSDHIRAGSNLNQIRKRLGLSANDFSAKCDISIGNLNNYFYSDAIPRFKVLRQISNCLKVSPNEILQGLYAPSKELELMQSIEDAMRLGAKSMRAGTLYMDGIIETAPRLTKFDCRVRILREELGFERAELAYLTGVSVSAIAQYESAQFTPGGETFLALCRVLKVSPEYMMSGDLTFPLSHDGKLYRLTPKQLAYLDDILRVIT